MLVQSKHNSLWGSILAVVILAAIIYFAQSSYYQSENIKPAVPSPGDITVLGQLLCLPNKNTKGPQTLECAYGLKDSNGRYFGLRDSDPMYRNIEGFAMGVPVEVKGIFTPKEDDKYQSIGIIEIMSIGLVDGPKRMSMEGEYVCLPHKEGVTPTKECRSGIKSSNGLYYALDLNLVSQGAPQLKSGDQISAYGILVPVEQLSSDWWQKYNMEGIFSVTDSLQVQ